MIGNIAWATALYLSVLTVCASFVVAYLADVVADQLDNRRDARVEIEREREKTSRQVLDEDDDL